MSRGASQGLVWGITIILIVGSVGYLFNSYSYLLSPVQSPKTVIADYTGKVIQVDHVTHTSGGLFFTSSRTDTYVTFDNGQTYWKPGYEVVIEGYSYHVHSVKTTVYGPQAGGNGTLTTTENTFSSINQK